MVRRFTTFLTLVLAFLHSYGDEEYAVFIDLEALEFDRLHVKIYPPQTQEEEINFLFPSYLPGSAERVEIGKLVIDLKAFNQNDFTMRVRKNSNNEYAIANASKLKVIEYWVDDTYDYFRNAPKVFAPLGTNFEENENYLINFHALIGYLEGFEDVPFTVTFYRPKDLYASTSARVYREGSTIDRFYFPNFRQMADHPVMYCRPDTVKFRIDTTDFIVSVYSQNGKVLAEDVASTLIPVCEGIYSFCEGIDLPKFTFLFFFSEDDVKKNLPLMGNYGAVQHINSSVFHLSENEDLDELLLTIQKTASHELLHIFPPLNLKTDVTSKFNFDSRKPTQNLWYYEGITEYFSLLMQVRYDLISFDDFLYEIRTKINLAEKYEPFSMVDVSSQIDVVPFNELYPNFYHKGALVALLLDIKLLDLSEGDTSLLVLLDHMHTVLGPSLVIKDEDLISEFVNYSMPEIELYFNKYVIGNTPLPYNDYFEYVGIIYKKNQVDRVKIYANISWTVTSKTNEVKIKDVKENFVGFEKGDVLLKIGEEMVTPGNIKELMEQISDLRNEDQVTFTVERGGEEIVLSGDPWVANRNTKNVLELLMTPTAEAAELRNLFLYGTPSGNTSN